MSTEALPTGPARLWRQLSSDQRLVLARALWDDDESTAQRAEAVVHIARQMKFRIQYVQKLARDKQVHYLATVSGVPDAVAGRALVVYHLAQKRPMLHAFLDHLGIANDDGLISGQIDSPNAATLTDATRALMAEYPIEDVKLYLLTLFVQDRETWQGLDEVLRTFDTPPSGL